VVWVASLATPGPKSDFGKRLDWRSSDRS